MKVDLVVIFLMNCLCLSDSIIINGMNIHNKMDLWIENLENKNNLNDPSWKDFTFLSEMVDLHEDKTFCFVQIHSENEILNRLNIFKNIKIIQFINPRLFKSIRRCILRSLEKDKYNIEKTKELSINFRQFMDLDQRKKDIIIEKYNNISEKIHKIKYKKFNKTGYKKTSNYYCWDVNWYLSEKQTLDNIEMFYNKFGLTGFDEKIISKIYNIWIDKMDELKEISLI